MWQEFKMFVMRGNVVDMAVGIIIGVAFGRIVTSLVSDIIMPPIGLLLGHVDFSNLFVTLRGTPVQTLADAKKAGAVTINYGVFVNTILQFIIVALAVFLVVRVVQRMMKKEEAPPAPPSTKDCPYCASAIPIKATRCPQCTSELKAA